MLAISFNPDKGRSRRGRRLAFQTNPLGISVTRLAIFAVLGIAIISLHWAYRDPIIRIRMYDGHFPISLQPEDRQQLSSCSQIWDDEFQRLQKSSRMLVQTYMDGKPLQSGDELRVDAQLCVLVAAPQSRPPGWKLRYAPVSGMGPDDMRLLINSSTVQLTFPPLKPVPGQASLTKLLANDAVLYYAEPVVKERGNYEIHVWREWTNWQWSRLVAKTVKGDKVVYNSNYTEKTDNSLLASASSLSTKAALKLGRHPDPEYALSKHTFPSSFAVRGQSNPKDRPLCGPDISPAKGRWYNAATYGIDKRFADEWGFAWIGDDCRLDYFTENDVFDCLQDRTIHVHGDSNSRRLTRNIITASRWCHNATSGCQFDDSHLPIYKLALNKSTQAHEPVEERRANWTNGLPFIFGKNTTLHFNFLQSLSLMQKGWISLLYDTAEGTEHMPGEATGDYFLNLHQTFKDEPLLQIGAKARPPPELPPADLVIIGAGAWDEALDSSFDEYETVLPAFRDAVLEAYKNTVKVIRLSQGYCCRAGFIDYPWRRFTGARIDFMTSIYRRIFKVDGSKAMDGKMQVIDPSGFAGRPEVVRDHFQDGSNHERAAHVRLEYQILLNQICRKVPKGKTRFRDDLKNLE